MVVQDVVVVKTVVAIHAINVVLTNADVVGTHVVAVDVAGTHVVVVDVAGIHAVAVVAVAVVVMAMADMVYGRFYYSISMS